MSYNMKTFIQTQGLNKISFWINQIKNKSLTHFSPVWHFQGGIEMWHWTKIGYVKKYKTFLVSRTTTAFFITVYLKRTVRAS